MKVISFYMNEQTERAAALLAKDLDRLGIAHDFEQVPDRGEYHKNRLHVPSWILWKLLDDPSQNVVWINPSGRVLEDPILLKDPECDLGVFRFGPAYWAKTLFVRNSAPARETLRRWANLNLESDLRISCENLSKAIEELKPKVTLLPPTYSWVEDGFPSTYGKNHKPVITHPMGGM